MQVLAADILARGHFWQNNVSEMTKRNLRYGFVDERQLKTIMPK